MSHFSTIKVKIKDKELLVDALKNLGFNIIVGDQVCRGYRTNKVDVEILIRRENGYDIGFKKDKDSYVVVADWWGIKDIEQDKLIDNLTQMYSILVTKTELRRKGFSVSEEKLSNGTVRLVAKRLS